MAQHPFPDPDLLMAGRVHEATGAGRRGFALALAGRLEGAVLWIQDARDRDALYGPGIAALMDPARLVLARPTGALAVLQVAEEALRSGSAPLVVAELEAAPDLTESRRLQLAAGTGGGRGLCLVPERRLCSNAVETRWRAEPVAGAGRAQCWEIVKNKRGRLGAWHVARPERGLHDCAEGRSWQSHAQPFVAKAPPPPPAPPLPA